MNFRKSVKSFGLKYIGFSFLFIFIFSLFLSCSSSSKEKANKNSDQVSEADDWINLFDGKSFDGWRTLGSDSVFTAFWKIEDGILKKIDRGKVPARADGQPQEGGDLMTIETFDNYELSWEWALFENGNSGLKYNVSEEMSMEHGSQHSALGFEYQMLDDSSDEYEDLKPSQFSGSLYDLLPSHDVSLKPFGEFNQSRIRIDGNEVTHWLNNQKVLSYTFGSPELKAAYEKSKFADIPGFIDKRKGHIVLQDHITEAWFRNIQLKKL